MIRSTSSRRTLLAGGALAATPAAAAILTPPAPYKDTVSKRLVRPGVNLAWEDEYFGPQWVEPEPLVMLHGVAESHVSWQQWVPVVGARYRVIRPDMPGFGQSPFPANYECSPKRIAADIVNLLDSLGVDRFHLVGAKFGGSVALQLAADFAARVKTLAVFGTPVKGAAGGSADLTKFAAWIKKDGVRGWAEATQRSRLGSGAPPEMLAWWTDGLMAKSEPAACLAYTAAAGGFNIEGELSRIAAPTLVVTTEASPLQPVAVARAYQEMIPHSKLLVMPGDSYHVAAVRPVECANRLLEFIGSA